MYNLTERSVETEKEGSNESSSKTSMGGRKRHRVILMGEEGVVSVPVN
jgi:hypothetical protein